jgi:serine/threonine protein kinase
MIEPGTLLQNRYRVIKQIGEGGMGAVYLATDERFRSTVAVKQTFFDDPVLRKAFEREAQLLNHLRHAALPKVSDHFFEGDGQFLVMEYIAGDDLPELMERCGGYFPLADVLRWADALLDALDYLHTHEPPIIHRDIKPQNLKLTPRGQIVLLDFGLAKGALTRTRDATVTGSVFGYTPNFAPLEQIQGTGTDARGDLYSLAATLYHILTGEIPIDALTRASAVINSEPDPLRPAHLRRPEIPEAISKVIHRAMSQKAALRQPTAAEMRAALRQAANTSPDGGRQASAAAARLLTPTQLSSDDKSVARPSPPFVDEPSVTRFPASPRPRRAVTSSGETTIVDGARGATGRLTGTNAPAGPGGRVQPSPRRLPISLICVVAVALLAACVAIPFALSRHTDQPSAGAASQPVETLGSAKETAAPAARQPEAEHESPQGAAKGETTIEKTQTPSAGSAGQDSSSSQSVKQERGASEAPNSKDGAAESNSSRLSSDLGTSTDGGGLVIQKPAPSPTPVNTTSDSGNADENARHAEDQRRRERHEPPPDEDRPPPPDGERPPPDGRRPPPPPPFRPPPRP